MSGGDGASGRVRGPHDDGLWFQVIGPFQAWRGDRRLAESELGSRKGRTLLKRLLIDAGRTVTREALVSLLWPDGPPTADRNLASLVSRLRALLGPGSVEAVGRAYRLRAGPGLEVDLHLAERCATQAARGAEVGAWAQAWAAVSRGLELVGDATVLEDETDADWVDDVRASLPVLRRDLRRRGWQVALAINDVESAHHIARAALRSDPLDEEACRVVMLVSQRRGETAVGLVAFDHLRRALAEELGAAPSSRTQEVHRALLRDEPIEPDAAFPAERGAVAGEPRAPAKGRDLGADLVGREKEFGDLRLRWEQAAVGRSSLVLITGEAGIGKTRLADELAGAAASDGGVILRARCFEAERSLFLGPIVEVVRSLIDAMPPVRLRDLAEPWHGTLAGLVPESAAALQVATYERASPRIEGRRTFEAVVALLRDRSREQPTCVLLDDLHHAGASTVELLHYLVRRLGGGRLLVVGTVRVEEGAEVLRELADVAEVLELGPLSDDAVAALARRAGASAMAERLVRSTRGHTLSVVESLRALSGSDEVTDDPPLPDSLRVAVLQRAERAGEPVEELLRAAAVLGSTFDLATVADLLDLGTEEVVRRVEKGLASRLLVDDGDALAFSNDLVREIVYQAIPRTTRMERHRRAARLLTGSPEAVALHAAAAEEWSLAFDAWLAAAESAANRYANRDAEALLAHAIEAAEAAGDAAGVAQARLIRGGVREALAVYPGAFEDLEAAADLARSSGRPDLEAAAMRGLGGDVMVGLGRPSTDCIPYLEAGLDVAQAARLGREEVELLGRLAVVWSNRARFDLAADHAERALARARELGDDRAIALALDAEKNVRAYLGDVERLQVLIPELERLLDHEGDLALLQWTVFESVVVPLAAGDWEEAEAVLERALAINRRTGYPWGALFLAHRSWIGRARGQYGRAIADAQAAGDAETSAGHPWWTAFADAMLGWVLSDLGRQEEAIRHLEHGAAAAESDGMETYQLRCLAHLALACWRSGDRQAAAGHLARAEGLLGRVTTPPGFAYLHGAHAYAAVARVHLHLGHFERATELLERIREPAEAAGWREVVVTDRLLHGRILAAEGDRAAAARLLEAAAHDAEAVGLVPLALEAHDELARTLEVDQAEVAAEHRRRASAHRAAIAASLEGSRYAGGAIGP